MALSNVLGGYAVITNLTLNKFEKFVSMDVAIYTDSTKSNLITNMSLVLVGKAVNVVSGVSDNAHTVSSFPEYTLIQNSVNNPMDNGLLFRRAPADGNHTEPFLDRIHPQRGMIYVMGAQRFVHNGEQWVESDLQSTFGKDTYDQYFSAEVMDTLGANVLSQAYELLKQFTAFSGAVTA